MIEKKDASGLDRRSALVLSAAAIAAASLPAFPATAATSRKRLLDPANAADASLIYRKLRYRNDDGLVFSWIKGPYMAAIAGDLIPVYAINLGSIQRITHSADGSFELIDLEISFRVDVNTGLRLTDLRNPVTGETVKVGGRGPIPTRVRVSATNEIDIPDIPGAPRFEHVHHPAPPFALRDGEIAVRDRSHARVTAPDGSVSYLNEVSTLSAPSPLVLDPAVTNVETRVQSNDVRSWPEWLKMGDRPGTLNLFGNGGKVKRFEDLPADWHAMLRTYYPQIAQDPVAALDKAG